MKTPTTQIQGIGPATATLLTKNGYKSAEDIASADIESLCKIPGFSAIRAGRVIAAATAIIPVTEKASSPSKKKGKTKSGKPKSKDKKKAGKSKDKSKKKTGKKDKKKEKKKEKKKDSKKSKSKKKGLKKPGKKKSKGKK